ncbi:hypothetical protein AB0C33_01670 [Nonomuraea sp. NPDC048881]|uniref:hypothetical protein n=1 Tax=unclassified Nonomuraea TaxID=2593643 RepID=UPI00340EE35A
MAMPRKGSRLITVDGTAFRWRVSHRPAFGDGSSAAPLTFVVERDEDPGRVLLVSLPCARPDNWRGARTIAIRPPLVAACVRRALEQGWTPARPGPRFTLAITEDELTELLDGPPAYLVPFLWGMIPEGGTIRDLPRARQIWSRESAGTDRTP